MSKVTLYMAISVDGFIAGPNNETPWSDEEWELYRAFSITQDAIVIGYKTYLVMQKAKEFVEGASYFVATNKKISDEKFKSITIDSKGDLPKVENICIAGGGDLNGRLAELGLIDEIIFDIEPVVLGSGIKLFGDHKPNIELELISSAKYGKSGVQNHYKVL